MKKIWDSDVKLAGRSGYSTLMPADKEQRENMALARGKELDISPKHAVEICKAIRGRRMEPAKNYLGRVILQKDAVPFRRYDGKVGHRKGKGFGRGDGEGKSKDGKGKDSFGLSKGKGKELARQALA